MRIQSEHVAPMVKALFDELGPKPEAPSSAHNNVAALAANAREMQEYDNVRKYAEPLALHLMLTQISHAQSLERIADALEEYVAVQKRRMWL